MKIAIKDITDALSKRGWQQVPLAEEAERGGLTLLCASPFAALGLVVVNSTGEINSRWGDCQVQMSELRKNEVVGKERDLYLAFVVERGDPGHEALLQTVLGDTHVCRKLYMALNGGTIEEAIQSVPCLQASPFIAEEKTAKIIPLLESLDLPGELKHDLATRGPAKILEKLLSGKYKRPERDE
ncbi:MAG: hypothetical protein ABSA83_07630 [Verrucomicrobiota bacterium]|jgi:hypothetical protein